METYLFELVNNRQALNRIDTEVAKISKTIYSKDLFISVKDESEKIKLIQDFQAFKNRLLRLKDELDIIYRSTQTKGKNYKYRDNPGLIGDIRGNVERIRKNINLPVAFVDDFIKLCTDLSLRQGKRTITWKATEQVMSILEQNKEMERTQASIGQPSGPYISKPNEISLASGVEIIALIVALSAMIKGYLEKKRI